MFSNTLEILWSFSGRPWVSYELLVFILIYFKYNDSVDLSHMDVFY